MQTALVALQPLRSRAGALAIELKPNARERREMTKLSSIGNCHGERIVSRCVEKLREVRPDDEASTDEQDMQSLKEVFNRHLHLVRRAPMLPCRHPVLLWRRG